MICSGWHCQRLRQPSWCCWAPVPEAQAAFGSMPGGSTTGAPDWRDAAKLRKFLADDIPQWTPSEGAENTRAFLAALREKCSTEIGAMTAAAVGGHEVQSCRPANESGAEQGACDASSGGDADAAPGGATVIRVPPPLRGARVSWPCPACQLDKRRRVFRLWRLPPLATLATPINKPSEHNLRCQPACQAHWPS